MHTFTQYAERFGNRFLVRPRGALGSCGFYPFPWSAVLVRAPSAEAALGRNLRFVAPSDYERRPFFVLELKPGLFFSDLGPMPFNGASIFSEYQKRAFAASGVWRALSSSGELAE